MLAVLVHLAIYQITTRQHTLTIKQGSVLRFGNVVQPIPANLVINCNDVSVNSTTIIVYWDLVSGNPVLKKFDAALTAYERFRYVRLATVKDGAMFGSITSGYDVVSVNIQSNVFNRWYQSICAN